MLLVRDVRASRPLTARSRVGKESSRGGHGGSQVPLIWKEFAGLHVGRMAHQAWRWRAIVTKKKHARNTFIFCCIAQFPVLLVFLIYLFIEWQR